MLEVHTKSLSVRECIKKVIVLSFLVLSQVNSIISLKTLKEKLSVLTTEADRGDEEERDGESTLTTVKDSLDGIIALCHQSSQNLYQQQREV